METNKAIHSKTQVSPQKYLSHRDIARQFLHDEVDIYEGCRKEKSYLIYEDGGINEINSADLSLILNNMSTLGGVKEEDRGVMTELGRSSACMKSQATMKGEVTEQVYLKRLHCMKWWCPVCGDKRDKHGNLITGEIHKDRKKAVYARLNAGFEIHDEEDMKLLRKTLSSVNQIQYVFTVPESERHIFKSKEGINKLCGSVKRIMCSEYSEEGMIAYIHVVGDESTKFHPHINVHIYQDKKIRVIPKDGNDKKLERIKRRYAKALIAHGCKLQRKESGYVVDVYKSFVKSTEFEKMLHRIKYMTKPIESTMLDKFFENKDEDMIVITVQELKGFRYIRYWGELSNNKYKQWFEKTNKKVTYEELAMKRNNLRTEEERLAGERLIAGGVISVDIEELKKRKDLEVEELAEGFWRIKFKKKENGNE